MEKFYLEKPKVRRTKDAIDFLIEFKKYNSSMDGAGVFKDMLEGKTYDECLEQLRKIGDKEYANKKNRCIEKQFFLIRANDNKIIGIVSIKSGVSEKIIKYEGNITYSIRPTERRKQYSKICLYLALIKAKEEFNLEKLTLTAEYDNIGINKTILLLGGNLAQKIENPYNENILTNIYTIDVNDSIRKNEYLYLHQISTEEEYNTIDFYNKNAKLYFEQTVEGNLKENYDRFLKHISKNAYILDFGCGSGRDSKYFIENGYKVNAIDGSIQMCKLASDYIKQEVEHMKFDDLEDVNVYDAIWACSSILHIEQEKLPNILERMIKALKQNGIIYTAFKKGKGYEIRNGKYYNFMTKEEMKEILNGLTNKVEIIDYFETTSSTQRAKNAIWVNFIIRKI